MKAFTGYKPEAPVHRETLPAGGYVAKILDAQELEYEWGNVLLISFGVTEGEYRDFFRRDYNAQSQEDKKWRGTLRLRVPKDDGTESDKWSKRSFNIAMWAVEESNSGVSLGLERSRAKRKNCRNSVPQKTMGNERQYRLDNRMLRA